MSKINDNTRQVTKLFDVMKILLAPGGCPWDREQTPQSLAPYAIEEAHELAEALERKDTKAVKEELGDFLLQAVFHACLAEQEKLFTFEEVVDGICEKLTRRHPHVFGSVKVNGSDEVLKNWAKIKKEEKEERKKTPGEASLKTGPFDIPLALPALQRAQKIGEKTKTLKFDWRDASEVLTKVEEEFREFKEAFAAKDMEHAKEELGDLFFVLAQLSRHLKFEAESVARAANRKFERRFAKLLQLALDQQKDFDSLSANEKEKLWEEVKRRED